MEEVEDKVDLLGASGDLCFRSSCEIKVGNVCKGDQLLKNSFHQKHVIPNGIVLGNNSDVMKTVGNGVSDTNCSSGLVSGCKQHFDFNSNNYQSSQNMSCENKNLPVVEHFGSRTLSDLWNDCDETLQHDSVSNAIGVIDNVNKFDIDQNLNFRRSEKEEQVLGENCASVNFDSSFNTNPSEAAGKQFTGSIKESGNIENRASNITLTHDASDKVFELVSDSLKNRLQSSAVKKETVECIKDGSYACDIDAVPDNFDFKKSFEDLSNILKDVGEEVLPIVPETSTDNFKNDIIKNTSSFLICCNVESSGKFKSRKGKKLWKNPDSVDGLVDVTPDTVILKKFRKFEHLEEEVPELCTCPHQDRYAFSIQVRVLVLYKNVHG